MNNYQKQRPKYLSFFAFILLYFGYFLQPSLAIELTECLKEERDDLINSYLLNKSSSEFYNLKEYIIHPRCKIIGKIGMVGGINWDGFKFFTIDDIDYEKTEYIFFVEKLKPYGSAHSDFKELLPPFAYDQLEILYTDHEQVGNIYLDQNTIYYLGPFRYDGEEYWLNIPKEWKRIQRYLWQDSNNSIFLALQDTRINPEFVDVTAYNLDISTFKHVSKNFYSDKNGLYWFGTYSNPGKCCSFNAQLAHNSGDEIIAKVIDGYLLYDESLYRNTSYSNMLKLPYTIHDVQNISQSVVYLKNGDRYNNYNDKKIAETVDLDKLKLNQLQPKVVINTPHTILFERDQKLYFINNMDKINDCQKEDCDIKRKGSLYYAENDRRFYQHYWQRELIEYDANDVYIYNRKSGAYESLEVSHFREVSDEFYIYKNALYGYKAPIFHDEKNINYERFQQINLTNYYTDGENVFFIDNQAKYYGVNRGDFIALPDNLKSNTIDFSSLKIIDKNTLIDNEHLYLGSEILKREEFGFPIKVYGAIPFTFKTIPNIN